MFRYLVASFGCFGDAIGVRALGAEANSAVRTFMAANGLGRTEEEEKSYGELMKKQQKASAAGT